MKNIIRVLGCLVAGSVLWSADADAATLNDYCVIPSFIQESILPNLLLVIDNSASMYDLAYADKGRRVCSNATGTECKDDSVCSGGTCSYVAGSSRQPYYCYDQTFSTANTYTGYFDSEKLYSYNFTDNKFVKSSDSTAAYSCAAVVGKTNKSITNNLCVVYDTAAPNTVRTVLASGNYLNWLTASKFDVQKKILTGGKYNGTQLLAESRGCVGQSFIKEALSRNFVNYNSPETNNTNTPPPPNASGLPDYALGIVFGVRGPYDALNRSAPSPGGQTYLDIYQGVNGFTRRAACQEAVDTFTTATNPADVKQDVCQCLTGDAQCKDTAGAIEATVKTKVAFQQSMQACWACDVSTSSPFTCGGTDINIDDMNTAELQCTEIYMKFATCANDPDTLCTTATPGTTGVAITTTGKTAVSGCGVCTYGPEAIVPGNPALFCNSSYMGQYYAYQGPGVSGTCIYGGGACDENSDCSPATYKQCSKTTDICTSDANCPGPGNKCSKIVTNTCSTTATTAGWFNINGSKTYPAGMYQTHRDFCGAFKAIPVTDPTDAPSNTASYDNIPAILGGTGAEAQLGSPIATLTVRLDKSPAPKGVVSDFSKQVRIGAMTFNFAGSKTESGVTVPATRVCDNNELKVCSIDLDCGPSPRYCKTPANTTNNLDGAKIVHYIGTGHCSATTATVCYNKSDCPSGESCESDGVGDYTAGLVKSINDITASSWTPFSEAFYDAIGYYAKDTTSATPKSRTAFRINATDFDENRNPAQFHCQSNNLLLISDGMSTADRHPDVDDMAKAYTTDPPSLASWTPETPGPPVIPECPPYGGSVNVDNMAWIGRNRNIQTMTATAGDAPTKKSERITTYVVFNGESNGGNVALECDSKTLLEKTATNGGTTLYQAVDPAALEAKLKDAFRDISGGAASGTAASILSNSEGSGANILQAVFFPKKDFADDTSASWIGEMQNLWYFVDPFVGNSSVREDTGYASGDHVMNLVSDYVAEFYFDAETNDTKARLKKDTDGDGDGDLLVTSADDARVTATVPGVVPADSVASIWRAGRLLWDRDVSDSANPRVFYTYLKGATATGCSGSFSGTTIFNLVTYGWPANDDSCILQKYLDAASVDEAKLIIRYIHGHDIDDKGTATTADDTPIVINGKTARDRSVRLTANGAEKVWKLGDIVSSTPRVQSSGKINNYHLPPAAGYSDTTYADDDAKTGFANTSDYKSRGMVYAGANDGMLHAFKLGTLTVTTQGATKATLTGSNLGEEQWAFIPKNVLPYLKYLADPAYSHLYLVDGSTKIVDASVGYDGTSVAAFTGANCTADTYWDCKRVPTTTSWRTILIGSMGVGGASRTLADTCTDKVAAGTCVKAPTVDAGASSYYALDITNPTSPQFLWEFSDPSMGYSTTGAGVARISYTNETGKPYRESNGRWYAVIGNGPTGPIDTATHQFKGKSDKPLKIFVLDLKNGANNATYYKTIEASALTNAFAGSLGDATIDTDRWNKMSDGFYSDDALYFGYSQCTANCTTDTPTWNGGVARLLTHEKPDPADWELTQLITGTGPVTASIGRLQERRVNHRNLWLYFGSGRYFYKEDDQATARTIIGVKDPCYKGNDDLSAPSGDTCKTAIDFSSGTGFIDQSGTIDTASTIDKGWFITLDGENVPTAGYSAERSITDPVAMPNGAVFFTTFKPSVDICSFGGNSYLWGVRYDTGGTAPSAALKAKALVQVSTGSFEEVNLSTALTAKSGRKMGTPMVGKPPNDPPPIVSPAANKPLKRVIHIRER